MIEVLARRLQRRIFLDRVVVAPGRRDSLAQMVGFLHFAYARGRRFGASHVIEDLAHQPLCDARRAFEQPLDLLFDAVAELFGVDILGQGLVREGVEEGERHPPEGALRAWALRPLDQPEDLALPQGSLFFDAREQAFKLLGYASDAFQTDYRERAVCLMQMRLARL